MSERSIEAINLNGLQQYYGNGIDAQNAQNCLGLNPQGNYLGCQPYVQYCYCSPPRDLHAFEIVIEQLSNNGEPMLNYGAKLRLLMADPFKGVELREAIHKLKTALKEAIKDAI